MRLPISLIIDDGSPVNPVYFLHPEVETKFIIPNKMAGDFAKLCKRYGVKGKYSVMPMPSGLGRIDRKLNYVPKAHLKGFIEIVKKEIMPYFDITPEILTHQTVYDIKRKRYKHMFEDTFMDTADVPEMTDYISYGFKILKKVGLKANGVTSPWYSGIKNEKKYAEAIGNAEYRVHKRKFAWYFLHCLGGTEGKWPWVKIRNKKRGSVVVAVPANTNDPFYKTWAPFTDAEAKKGMMEGVDSLLLADGKKGRIRELFDKKLPIVIVTHWQSIFSDGRYYGLKGFEILLKRIKNTFGNEVEWMKCSDLARFAIKRK